MGYSHKATRRDVNAPAIILALRTVGASVVDLGGVGDGVPDLLVGRHGTTWLMEVKSPDGHQQHAGREFDPDGELTDAQVEFLKSWGGCVVRIVHTAHEALAVVCVTEAEIAAAGGETT